MKKELLFKKMNDLSNQYKKAKVLLYINNKKIISDNFDLDFILKLETDLLYSDNYDIKIFGTELPKPYIKININL